MAYLKPTAADRDEFADGWNFSDEAALRADEQAQHDLALAETRARLNTGADAAFAGRKAAILFDLAAIRSAAESYTARHPGAINWGHVGDLARVSELLTEALRALGVGVEDFGAPR